jgi:hypothetical protein
MSFSNKSCVLYTWSLNPLHLSAILDIYLVIVGSSEYLCSGGGVFCSHSIEFEVWVENRICRLDLILSQRMKIHRDGGPMLSHAWHPVINMLYNQEAGLMQHALDTSQQLPLATTPS